MAQRLIDANKLVLRFEYGVQVDGMLFVPYRDMKKSVNKAPTVDAVPVVRCKDCEYSYESILSWTCTKGPCVDCIVPEDFFCQYGKRREENAFD